jgi:hypothetical protein
VSIEAMPILARDPKSPWARSMELRDWVYDAVEQACQQLNVDALVNKSIDFVFPAWVSLEAWLPAGTPGATFRRFCAFLIDPKPHSRNEFELRIKCERDGIMKQYGPYAPQATSGVAEWVRYMLDQGSRPSKYAHRIRKFPWEFWFSHNEVTGLGYDPLKIAGSVGLAAAVTGTAIHPIVAVAGVSVAVVCGVVQWRRKKVTVNVGRPIAEPRSLQLVDSWQTIICDLGSDWEGVRTRLFRRLTEGRDFKINPRLENISYLTPDGKQIRQQLVLSQGRGIVFCHAYAYGKDMYVGWEAYLNYGQWRERQLSTGFGQKLQCPVIINTVVPGSYVPNEYDLIDLNGLTEWAHTRVVQVLKQVIAEHKLDQEIDFKITQRGPRGTLISREEIDKERRPLFRRGFAAHERGRPTTFMSSE